MANVEPSAFVRRVAEISKALAAVAGLVQQAADLVHQVSGLLRQLVHAAGWLVLLYGLFQPHLSPEHLITPGAGALAVLQGLIKLQRRQGSRPDDEPKALKPATKPPSSTDSVDLDSVLPASQSDEPIVASLSHRQSYLGGAARNTARRARF